jgi:hypothetical protein
MPTCRTSAGVKGRLLGIRMGIVRDWVSNFPLPPPNPPFCKDIFAGDAAARQPMSPNCASRTGASPGLHGTRARLRPRPEDGVAAPSDAAAGGADYGVAARGALP